MSKEQEYKEKMHIWKWGFFVVVFTVVSAKFIDFNFIGKLSFLIILMLVLIFGSYITSGAYKKKHETN